MSKDKTVYINHGTNWVALLGVVFILLKVFGIQPVAAWSWWWVLCPFWIGLAIFLAIAAIGAAIVGIVFLGAVIGDWWSARARRKRKGL